MNLPNKLTTSRFFITIAFVIVVLWDRLPYHTSWAALLFFIGGLTDIADGIIARRRNLQTDFGALMDPLADKVLMCAGFVLLTRLELIPAWIVVVILSREFMVTGLRLLASAEGVVLAAENEDCEKELGIQDQGQNNVEEFGLVCEVHAEKADVPVDPCREQATAPKYLNG